VARPSAMMGLSPPPGWCERRPRPDAEHPRAQRNWDQLSWPLRRSLLWLNAGTLLRARDLLALAWPVAHCDRRNAGKRLREWASDRLIVVDPTPKGATVRLGPLGAAKLREAGVVETVRLLEAAPAERVLAGLLLATQVGAGLALDLLPSVAVAQFAWRCDPFRGSGVRADAIGGLYYDLRGRPLRAPGPEILTLVPDLPLPEAGHAIDLLYVEIDLGTETSSQLAERAEHWHVALAERYATLPDNCWPTVLWVVDGGLQRMATVWRCWLAHARAPLLITTTEKLTFGTTFHPWHATWWDEHGRERTLNPWIGEEPTWRLLSSVPPDLNRTLSQAIAAARAAAGRTI
jgi:hypothetical protein